MLKGLTSRGIRAVAIGVALVMFVGFLLLRSGGEEPKTVTAHFPRAVSIYENSDVRIQGVRVGKVTAVVPAGNSVRVEMEYEARFDLPKEARASIITPTLVADRFVQLSPTYVDGPKLESGGDIPLAATGVPVELDRIYASLRDLSAALGPNGANADGTLNHLLTVGAKTLKGKGALGNQMINDLSEAAETFGQGSGDLFETVRNLAAFTEVVARNDQLVRAFLQDLAGVSSDLAAERDELEQALAEVATAVGAVRTFVRDNRKALVTDLEKLTRVTKTIASERASLNRALTAAPVAIDNLNIAFDVDSGSIGSRIGVAGNIGDSDGFLCSVVQQAQLPQASKDLACRLFEQLLEPVTAPVFGGMTGTSGTSPRTSGSDVAARYSPDTSATLDDLMGGR